MSSSTGTPLMWPGTIRHLSAISPDGTAVDALSIQVENDAWCNSSAFPHGDRDMFYAEDTASVERSRSHCARCLVRPECLLLATLIPAGRHGVWGGTTPDERGHMCDREGLSGSPGRPRTAAPKKTSPAPRRERRAGGEKRCSGCKLLRPVGEYWSCATRFDGLQAMCKTCKSTANRRWRRENGGRQVAAGFINNRLDGKEAAA